MFITTLLTTAYDKQENELEPLPGYKLTKTVSSKSLQTTNAPLQLLIRRYSFEDYNTSHCLYYDNKYYFKRIYHLSYKQLNYVYCLAKNGDNSFDDCYYIKLNYIQNLHFNFLQNTLWIQQEENIRYLINIIFLILGAYISYLQLFS